MSDELTVREMAAMGGRARAQKYGTRQIRAWGKQGGRPPALDANGRARLGALLAEGKTQAEAARILGVPSRTVARYLAEMNAGKL